MYHWALNYRPSQERTQRLPTTQDQATIHQDTTGCETIPKTTLKMACLSPEIFLKSVELILDFEI